MTAATTTKQPRWSSARDCARKAVYEAQDAPRRDRTDQEQRILFRGKRIGRDYADFLAARYGEDAIVREKPVRFPWGTGHIDIYVKETRTAIEVLSSASPESQIDSKLLQLAGYILHDPDCSDVGMLVLLDPRDFSEDRVTLKLTDEWRERVNDVVATVGNAIAKGTLPDRVCRKPSDARGHFCVFADHCFDGWQPPALPVLDNPEVRQHVATLHQLKRKEREAKGTLAAIEEGRKQVEAVLADADLPYGHSDAGDYRIRRTLNRRETVSLKKLRAAALVPEDALADVVSVSTYDTWAVDLVGTAAPANAEDYGEVPF